MYALNATTGAPLWQLMLGGSMSSPVVANGVVYVGSYYDNVYALNASTGATLWNYQVGMPVDSAPAVANGMLYISSSSTTLIAFGLPSQ